MLNIAYIYNTLKMLQTLSLLQLHVIIIICLKTFVSDHPETMNMNNIH